MNKYLKSWTDNDKWLCTARWINAMYLADYNRELLPDGEGFPCVGCPNGSRCPSKYTDNAKLADGYCICENFKVIEQFTGPGTINGPFFPKPKRDIDPTECPSHLGGMDNQLMDICPFG